MCGQTCEFIAIAWQTLTDNAQLALTQIYKVTAEVVHRFEFEMAHDQPWKTHNATFLLQSNVICKVKRRSVENRPL